VGIFFSGSDKTMTELARTLALLATLCICQNFGQNLSTESQFPSDPLLSKGELPLIQCCNAGESYRPGLDFCKNDSVPDVDPLPIFSLDIDQKTIVTFMLGLNDERIKPQRMLKPCQEGFIARTSDRFQLFQDFSMKMDEGGELYPAADYCLYPQMSKSYSKGPFQYAVRYCVHADCDVVPCIRKCCPLGMVVNLNDKECELNDEPFNETVHEMLNIKTEMKIVDGYGFGMHCYDEASNMMELNEFRILPSGQMYAPDYPYRERATYQYCVDNFAYIETVSIRRWCK
jgi:hypothetical protein